MTPQDDEKRKRALAVVQGMLAHGTRFVDQAGESAAADEVVEALLRLSGCDETEIVSLASEGRLPEVFPYRIEGSESPELQDWNSVIPAPTRRLTDEEYEELVMGGIPPSLRKPKT